jgi:indoleamine 2,3-dioxygenase
MKWQLRDRGFLPTPDPLTRFPHGDFAHVEELGRKLPELVYAKRFREEAPKALRTPTDLRLLASDDNGAEAERLFLLFSYVASAYIHAPSLPVVKHLPREIAVPLVQLAERCGRPPILSYASYCLHNWRRLDAAGPIALGNIELLQNFSTPGEGKADEDWFILVHVDIEARAGTILPALASLPGVLASGDAGRLAALLQTTRDGLEAMNQTLARMPEGCSPDVYFRKVRPYIFGFDQVVYEDCFRDVPQSYRGETGAQSSIIPTLLEALGIRHQASLLTEHLGDMRNYMPVPHRRFIESQANVRDAVVRLAGRGGPDGERVKELYNGCIGEVVTFRAKHFEYAINYIHNKVDNPLATGGTPYVQWLKQLLEETKEHYV